MFIDQRNCVDMQSEKSFFNLIKLVRQQFGWMEEIDLTKFRSIRAEILDLFG